jgi:hypothetical protein
MRIVTNVPLARRNRRIGQTFFFISLFLLISGFIVINAPLFVTFESDTVTLFTVILPVIILPLAFVTTVISVRLTNQWIRVPRPEIVIPENLKAMGKEAVFYSYYHFPARHVLICQQGVFAIVTRHHDNTIEVTGSAWTVKRGFFGTLAALFRLDGVGNPTDDARKAAAHVQQLIDGIAPEITVQPLIVFTDPRVKVTITHPDVPVLFAQNKRAPNLNEYLKSIPKQVRKTLTDAQIKIFEAQTIGDVRSVSTE